MIKVEKLKRVFKSGDKEIKALKEVSFEVVSGEFVSIVGRSGSGKSTLLYQMGLLDHPTSGKVIIDGKEVTDFSEDERTTLRLKELGYVFQDFALVPELTALENVAVPLLMQGLETQKAKKRAEESLSRFGLSERINNLPNALSGGEQQRVAIARAIVNNPKVIFADEPTANLDNETALSVIKVFQDLHEAGQTIVMVTHEPEYAKLTDRVITLFDGEVTADERI